MDGALLDACDPGAGEEFGAALGVPVAHRGGDLGRHRARERAVGGLDDGDRAAGRAGRGGELGADPARSDDDHVVLPLQYGPQPRGVVEGAQQMDSGDALGARQSDRLRTGGEDQGVVGDGPLGGVQFVRPGPQAGHVEPQAQRDVQGLEVDVEGGVLGLAEQDRLGQGRPVVRLVRLGPDQGDRAGEALFAQGDGRLHTGHAGAHDHDVPRPFPRCGVLRLLAHPSTLVT